MTVSTLPASQLRLYNLALLEIGERSITAAEDNESRRTLDVVWDSGLLIDYLLGQGHWNFASRTSHLTYDPSIEPDFGYQRAFEKPSDWIRTSAFSADEHFSNPLEAYEDEAEYWFADVDDIYVKYVSNDASYGNDLSLWPKTFERWAVVYLASRVCERLTQNRTKADALKAAADPESKRPTLLFDARAKDAQNEPSRVLPAGSWSRSRRSRGGERGSRSRLIG